MGCSYIYAQSVALQGIAKELDGYLADLSETTQPVMGTHIRQTLRIPALRLNEAMERIEALGDVQSRNLSTRDVTLDFVDMQSRLRNLEKTEERLLVHLERTGAMKDILEVEKEITRIRVEIETIQGRILNLSNQIVYATVQVILTSVPTAGPISPAAAFSTSQTFTDALRNLIRFAQRLWIIVIWVSVWSPVWIPLALLIGFLYRRLTRSASAAQ